MGSSLGRPSPIARQRAEARAKAPELAAAAAAGPGGFAEHIDEVPVLLLVVADLRALAAVDRDLGRYTMVGGASVYPFCWSVLLASAAEGLGGVITTMVVKCEDEVREPVRAPGRGCRCRSGRARVPCASAAPLEAP